jgi:hypothetical protein
MINKFADFCHTVDQYSTTVQNHNKDGPKTKVRSKKKFLISVFGDRILRLGQTTSSLPIAID